MDEATFLKLVDQLLKKTGRSFQGIHLQCKGCGEHGLAQSLEVARIFGGWTEVLHLDGPHHAGLCIDCSHKSKHKAKNKRRKP